ncbi:aspartyl protease family protein [Myroides profundi]|uniref:Aspartyl protease n=1 Tax=Myroides profundi TaxID=480520 RepID=A0AAJ4W5U3_MYRPR|nr:aspartyl protease family protein [Myroides profundi]AJH14247.1 hypothetical protein MPR_1058 [Myroides profundi]SER28577.1 Aspartyl protease [Myroides profundi]
MKSKSIYLLLFLMYGFFVSYAQVLTIPYEEKNGWPIIKVEVEGKEYDFLFDTGAAISLFDKKYFDIKNVIREITLSDISNKETQESLVSLDRLTISGKVFNNVIGINNDNMSQQHHFMCDVKLHGIIGIHMLKNYIIEIDPIGQHIKLYNHKMLDKKVFDTYTKHKYKSKDNNGRPSITAIVNGIKTQLLFDTGSTGYLAIPNIKMEKFVSNYKNKVVYSEGRRGVYGLEKTINKRIYLANAPIKFGNLEIKEQSFILEDNLLNNIGFQFIKEYHTYIDFYNKIIYLKKIDNKFYCAEEEIFKGFTLGLNDNGCFYVNSINSDNDLLQIEDVVLKINDQELPLSHCDIKEFFKQIERNKGVKKIRILRANQEMDIDYTYKFKWNE